MGSVMQQYHTEQQQVNHYQLYSLHALQELQRHQIAKGLEEVVSYTEGILFQGKDVSHDRRRG